MAFDFQWDDPAQTIMRYTADGAWDWNIFHKTLRRSTLRFDEVAHPVSALIDLRGSTKLPAGAVGHLRSLLTSLAHTRFSGRAAVVGVDAATLAALGVRDSARELSNGRILFDDDLDSARAKLTST